MIDRNHALPITRQAELVGISRGNVYYLPRAASGADLRLMKRIDALNLAHPFAGSRMLRDMLNREGFEVGRRHVATLMERMGIQALYRKPNTSKKHPTPQGLSVPAARAEDRSRQSGLGHRHHVHPDGVWLGLSVRNRGLGQPASAVAPGVDQHGRLVLRGGAARGLQQVRAARDLQQRPRQDQFTSEEFTQALKERGVAISMDQQGSLAGQHFRRAVLAVHQIRRGLPPRLRLGQPGQVEHRAVHRFLQHRAAAFVAGQADPGRVLLRDAAGDETGSMSGEHELPTASVVRYVASDARPPPWTTLHRCQTRRASTYRSQFGVQTTGAASAAIGTWWSHARGRDVLNILATVEDHPVVSEATSELLTDLESAACVSIAASVIEARAAIERERHWNTVLLDLDVPGAQGLSSGMISSAQLALQDALALQLLSRSLRMWPRRRHWAFSASSTSRFQWEEFTAALRRVLRGEQAFPSVEGEARP